ncbi:hypothetical protein [Pontibacillus litoralis]|uniref:Uncharacterized protein n=1 Tax=Pontibacillus litoralis JSM 072002 TaxID=1385512 RepID=A0A0A5HZ37_9BACI|nr:hypothetical protein [Pontibacillus litoralis]KGX88877.1 hypothetical protein N784_00595 [Pontibacillus litoralis JSM 072002]
MSKKQLMYIVIGVLVTLIGSTYVGWKQDNTTAVKYFPIDTDRNFEETSTSLTLLSESDQDEYTIQWSATSSLAEPIYLRQDVSLLYEDGRLHGILSKWEENGQNISQKKDVHGEDSSHYQAVTFHHGEVHYPDDKIKSIQNMSEAELYVIDSPLTPLESFVTPGNATQQEWKETLDHATEQQLMYEWNQLINHFQIPKNKYEAIPLTSLPAYETKPLPSLTNEQTQQVIGQLWEGLYKNYILDFLSFQNSNQKAIKSYVPLLLADREGKHLLVLYENSRGEKEKLIQRYPDFSMD